MDKDVPHFDRQGHFRRQEVEEERVRTRRRRLEEERGAWERESQGGDLVFKFFVVGSVVTVAWIVTAAQTTVKTKE